MLILPKISIPIDFQLVGEALIISDEVYVVFQVEVTSLLGINIDLNAAEFSCLFFNIEEGNLFIVFCSSPPLHFLPEISLELIFELPFDFFYQPKLWMSTVR